MTELEALETQALDLAQDLAIILHKISDLHWMNETVNPVHRASDDTIDLLKEIEEIIDVPMNEIKCTL